MAITQLIRISVFSGECESGRNIYTIGKQLKLYSCDEGQEI